jgi:hypothetical protein
MNYNQKKEAAKDPNTPTETLEFLATDEDPYVRQCVGQNPNASQETLKQLATDEDSYVRYLIGRNPNRTELIERLVLMTEYQLYNA